MKKIQGIILLGSWLLAGGSYAQTPTPPLPGASKIGVINLQFALAQTAEGKKELDDLAAKAQERRKQLEGLQKEIERLQQQLNIQATSLNETAVATLRRQIEAKQRDLQRRQEDAEEDFKDLSENTLNKLGRKMMTLVEKYAQEQGFTAIVEVGANPRIFLWLSPTADITSEMIRRYDAAYSIAAPKPAPSSAPPVKPPAETSTPAKKP